MERQSSIESTFFRPSLSRTTLWRKAVRYGSRQQQEGSGQNKSIFRIIGVVAIVWVASQVPTGSNDNGIVNTSGFQAIHLDESRGKTSILSTTHLPKGQSQVVIDPDTKQEFPLYLYDSPISLPSTGDRLKLVGLGVRAVSFLRVKVYVAGLYMDETKVDAIVAQGGLNNGQSLEQLVKNLLDEGATAVVRIVPVRNTDFNHLRDGFIRALQGRLKKAIKEGVIQSPSDTEKSFEESISQIKESFPRGSVPKGSPLDLVIAPDASHGARKPNAALNFEYDGQVFGQVKTGATSSSSSSSHSDSNFSAARELVLAYFADKNEISPAFKESVRSGFSGE